MIPAPKLLYTRAEAAETLSLCLSSIDVMIARKMLRATRKGRRVLIHRDEIERIAGKDLPRIWPEKWNGKTTRPSTEAAA